MKITDILVEDAVLFSMRNPTRRRALLEEMAGAFGSGRAGLGDGPTAQGTAANARALQSTGIGEGVAIPHGKVVGLDGLVASFARSRPGIDFDAIDQQPTHLCSSCSWSPSTPLANT